MYVFGIDMPIALVFTIMLALQIIMIIEAYLIYKKVVR